MSVKSYSQADKSASKLLRQADDCFVQAKGHRDLADQEHESAARQHNHEADQLEVRGCELQANAIQLKGESEIAGQRSSGALGMPKPAI